MGGVRLFETANARLVKSQMAHAYQVHAVAASPRGDLCASADDSGVVKLWRAKDLTLIRSWDSGGGRVDGLVFSKDGTTLYIGSSDGAIRRVLVDENRRLEPLRRHTSLIYSLSIDASGTTLVSSGGDRRIVWWDLESGGAYRNEVWFDANEILFAMVSPDGKWVAAAGESGSVRLWQDVTGGPWLEHKASEHRVYALAWHPTKPLLAWSGLKGMAGTLELTWRDPTEAGDE